MKFLQEPERALEIYEEARKRNPRDTQLAAKMGQALQKTHQYGKAINYYREAVKNEDHGSLRYDLAELLVRNKTFTNGKNFRKKKKDPSKNICKFSKICYLFLYNFENVYANLKIDL